MDVDLDDAGIGRHLDDVEARIARRLVALDVQREPGAPRRFLDRRNHRRVVFRVLERRHEHAELVVPHLDRQRGAHCTGDNLRSCRGGRARRLKGNRATALHQHLAPWERWCWRERIARQHVRMVDRIHHRRRTKRQAETERRIARDEE
jgi:hypothetical protein